MSDTESATSRFTVTARDRGTSKDRLLRPPPMPRAKQSYTALAAQDLSSTNVFGIVHRIRRDIKKCIETALTWEQVNSPKLTFSVIRPLQDAYLKLNSPCTIYALLLNRVFFESQQYTLSSLSVNNTRAMVCELLATKIVRQLYEEDTSENGVFRLAILLASAFSPFQGAPHWAVPEDIVENSSGRKMATSALELAIVSEAKRFIRAVPTQRVINNIWIGKIVYSTTGFRYLIKDQYKRRPIMKYDLKAAPLLDHYRLRVPRIRAALEWLHFFILFLAYLAVLRTMQPHDMNGWEIFWIIYAFGFSLDKFASLLELGWTVFSSNLWNGLDFIFIIMFIVYLPLRVIGLKVDHDAAAEEALSILTCAGCILFPRLAFVTLSDNLLILSLRSMLAQFAKLMFLAIWCFAGFVVAFAALGGGKYKAREIVEWMTWIWFGLDATGMQKATRLHNTLGPILMNIYACLSNTLVITVLVSILSNTFNKINSDAIAEQMYRRAVSTFQGVKSDGIFSFQPPINILALTILRPCRFLVDAHQYHKIIVFFARLTNLPLLLTIHVIERYFLFRDPAEWASWLRVHHLSFSFFKGAQSDLSAVFEYEDDIDDDSLPGGAFQVADGDTTDRESTFHGSGSPGVGNSTVANGSRPGNQTPTSEERRKRRGFSMSEWGGGSIRGSPDGQSTLKARPTPLSKLYAPRGRMPWRDLDEEQDLIREKLASIEEGQRRIEEALRGLGGGD